MVSWSSKVIDMFESSSSLSSLKLGGIASSSLEVSASGELVVTVVGTSCFFGFFLVLFAGDEMMVGGFSGICGVFRFFEESWWRRALRAAMALLSMTVL